MKTTDNVAGETKNHTSVLLQECIDGLHLKKGMTVLDATFGGGGHSTRIAETIGKTGFLIGIDADTDRVEEGRRMAFPSRAFIATSNFRNLDTVLKDADVKNIDAALFDLGLSSMNIESSGRGFSFLRDEPLLMTFASSPANTDVMASTVVNHWSEETIADILYGFGEEHFSRRIAKAIVERRKISPIMQTSDLANIIIEATPAWYHKGRIHPATKTFQAIRMAVNDELGALSEGITKAISALKESGYVAVISFHSTEDRAVKNLFRALAKDGVLELINKKPIIATKDEQRINPRSRSAKLRIAKKVSV